MIGDQAGLALPLAIEHEPPTSYSAPVWSPDSRSIAFTDKRLNLWNVDVALGVKKEDGTDQYMVPAPTRDLSWSPDQNGCVRHASAQPVPRDHCPLRSRRSHTPTDRPPVQRSPARSDPSPLQPQRDVEPVAAPRAPSDSARGAAPTTVTLRQAASTSTISANESLPSMCGPATMSTPRRRRRRTFLRRGGGQPAGHDRTLR